MALLISCATGNWLTAGTWALVDSTSYLNSETTSTAITTSYVASSTFTPGAITIDAIAIKVATRTATIGTLSIALDLATVTVTGTEVMINVADLNASVAASLDGGWVVFKFASPVTLAGATAYGVKIKTSSASQVVAFSLATTNWSRALRTTTTQAPVAGDDVIVAGEHTGAGTGNNLTVTMNETAATDYGSNTTSTVTPALAICKRGTLAFNDASAANPKLRLSGHAIVYNGGTLNIGTVATPIPRDSTAILEFDCTADGDFGLVCRNGSTITMQGLSRTAGKNITACKLAANTATNLTQASAISQSQLTNTGASTTPDPTGTTLASVSASVGGFNMLIGSVDTVTSANHRNSWTLSGGTVAGNTTQTYTHWIKRGTGTNNRYVRMQLGSTSAIPPTNGFYADFDLQAVTAGTCTAVGNGTSISATITAYGGGYICTIIGKASSATTTPIATMAACNAAGGVTYAGDTTQNFITTWPRVCTASAQPTDLTVDTDTGWLANDVIAIAATTRTANECELVQIGANAGASTLICALYPCCYHDGLSPVQAEAILITRNVKVRSTSPTVMSYVFIDCPAAGTTSVDLDWTEFYQLGENATNKRGLEVSYALGFVGSVSMQYCSIHDTEDYGLYLGAEIANTTVSNNTMWHLATIVGQACQIAGSSIATNYVIDSNILLHTATGVGWSLLDLGGTFTNNTVAGATGNAFNLNEAASIGTLTGLIAHSGANNGFNFQSGGTTGSLNGTSWRNSSFGFNFSAAVADVILDNPICFGNIYNISFLGGGLWLKSPVLNGDSVIPTPSGIATGGLIGGTILVDSGDFSTPSGIKTAHSSSDIVIPSGPSNLQIVLRNTKLGAATEVSSQFNLSNNGYISSQKNDQTAGNHKTWMKNGTIQTDATTYNTNAPSLLMTPTSATLKLENAPQFQGLKVAVNNNSTATVSCYVRKSATYNGNQPRLIQKANPALSQDADVVLATLVGGTGSWIQMSGTTSTATDDGAWEIVVDCDGTVGTVNIDDFVVS